MSFILPRRLTQFSRSAKGAPQINERSEPKDRASPGFISPGPLCGSAGFERYCCGCGASGWSEGAGAPATGAIGVGCAAGFGCDSSSLFFLFARRVFSPVAVDVFFFFFEVPPDNPRGADCVCWSATSAALGGAGPAAPAAPPLAGGFGIFGARARALKRVFCAGAVGSSGLAGCSVFEAVSGSAPAFSVAEFTLAEGSVSRGA